MADAARNITIKVLLDEAKARAGLKRMGDDAEQTESRWSKMGAGVKAGMALAGAAVISFLGDAVKAAAEDEKAQKDLERQLKASTGATDAQVAAVEDYIDKTARATGVSDDELRPALETLARATGDATEAQELLTGAMDIAAATGKPLQTVVDAISKAAQNGSTGGLARLGLKIKDVNGEMLTLDEIMGNAEDTMGGAMSEAADTAAGKMARLQVAVDEAKESLGTALLPIVEGVTDALFDLETQLNKPYEIDPPDPEGAMAELGQDIADIAHWYEDPHLKGIANFFGVDLPHSLDKTKKTGDGAKRAMEEIIPVLEDTEDAARDVGDATRYSTDAFYKHRDAARALADPVFALAEAEREQAEAITAAKDAAEEYGRGSPEHLTALGKVADAAYDVQDAEKAMGDQSGTTRKTMETHLRSLRVYTEGQIQLMLDEFDKINAYKFQAKNINVTHKVTGGGVQEFAQGGVVQGPPGAAVPIIAHAGETVLPTHKNGRGRAATPMTNNITIHAGLGSDPNAISRALVEALQRYDRSTGPIPIRTRSA